jgi:hypothetical protein
MSQESVDFVKSMLAASSGMDKEALLAALPEFIEQTCDPGGDRDRGGRSDRP